ncbi:putative arrestin-related trafficking adapter [Neolecta irregularis DAH-3]|uniref:Putative arrestin-related trafficking adapter n=1 Tax=Neolecta irregularis (strain DAH-3) TaxID=1198029 RepID=A0A1U7LTQ1_NEOID|nr:putative arrestin-related trafficking adapter [Neolecta irregularis DAH-3]|eukprot:OLL26055.1 putative arrestin-related trafficking adapter [Neolecta irregularis DAH-3]
MSRIECSHPRPIRPLVSSRLLSRMSLPLHHSTTTASHNTTSVCIVLAEPVLFLAGMTAAEYCDRGPVMLRGRLIFTLRKAAKIRSVTLSFRGRSSTVWLEGVPPNKTAYSETLKLVSHLWTFFDARNPVPDSQQSPLLDPNASAHLRGFRLFPPGIYAYPFELPLPTALPETIECARGHVRYSLEAIVERPGAFRSNLTAHTDVLLIRNPIEGNLESSEPIAVSRNWDDQLYYDIAISGKAFPIGALIPIAIKLTPLAKVHVHKIKVVITEVIDYYCRNGTIHRAEPPVSLTLYEQSSPSSSSNLLHHIDSWNAGSTEFEWQVPLPACVDKSHPLHCDTTYRNIKVHHTIRIILRLSRTHELDSSKRRHFEISVDSPVHLLSCRCTPVNTDPPAYNKQHISAKDTVPPCPCQNSIPPCKLEYRPMHLLRQPSNAPPAFDADTTPPELTPPPGYDTIASDSQQLGSFEVERADDDGDLGRRHSYLRYRSERGGSLDMSRLYPSAHSLV